MKFCRHVNHRVINDIWEPKWSTREILINVDKIVDGVDNYLFMFSNESAQQKYGWFYLSGDTIRKHQIKPNGKGRVYVVPLSERESFVPINKCEHEEFEGGMR